MKKKLAMGLGALAAIAAPAVTLVACGGDKGDDLPKYVKYSGGAITADKTYFVTDGGQITDQSFNQSGYEGWSEATGKSDSDGQVEKPTNASKIIDSFKSVKSKDGKMIVAMGFNHLTSLKRFSLENPNMGFVFVDEKLDSKNQDGKIIQQGNVVSIVFKTEQAAFLQGVVAASKALKMDSTDPAVGYWGGMDIPTVNAFIVGLKKGVKFYNDNKKDKNAKDVKLLDGGYVGNFDAGNGKAPAADLISKGAELLLGVAGPQEFDAVTAIIAAGKKDSEVQVIGVDTDMAKQVEEANKKYVFSSIQKGLKIETKNAVQALLTNTNDAKYGFGKVVTASLDGKGVFITDQENKLNDVVNELDSKTKVDIINAAKTISNS